MVASWILGRSARRPLLPLAGMILLGGFCFVAGVDAQTCDAGGPDSAAVAGVAVGIVEADNARDLRRVLEYYAEDAVLHPPMEAGVVGRVAIRPRYEALFSGYDPEIVPELRDVSVCGNLAVVAGRNGGLLRGRDNRPDRELSDAFVMVLSKVSGVWVIVRLMWHPDR